MLYLKRYFGIQKMENNIKTTKIMIKLEQKGEREVKKKTGGCMKKIGTIFMATLLILDGIFCETDVQAATCSRLDKNKEQITIYSRKQADINQLTKQLILEKGSTSEEENEENAEVASGGSVTSDGAIIENEKGNATVSTEIPGIQETPKITEEPDKVPTNTLLATKSPEQTLVPEVTKEPESTKNPVATKAPIVSKAPITTQAPIVTKAPEKTMVPIMPTATPITTALPIGAGTTTGSAVVTSKPASSTVENTSVPVATMKPDGSAVEEVVYCSVHYRLNGGTNAEGNPSRVYASGASYQLKDPKKKGYTFEGWYLESTFKHRVYYVEPNGASSITYYAKWKIVTVQKPKIISAKRLKSGKIRVKVGNNSGVDGYEYVYSQTPSMAKKSLVRSVKNPKDLTKLKKKGKYYIKVRCYKYDSWGRKVYGSYSKVVKCK